MNQFRSTVRAFVVALLATVLMEVVRRFVFIQIFGFTPPAMPFIFAVIAAVWIGGFQSGLFATVLGAGMLAYLFSAEVESQIFSLPRQMRLTAFIAIGGLISWGFASLHTARQRSEDRQRELEEEMRRRARAEIELREREERIRLAVEAADIGTFDVNPLTGAQEWSSRTKVMFGLSADADLKNVNFRDRLHPEDRERVSQAVQKALDPSGDGSYEIDCRMVWPDDTIRWFIAKGQSLFEGEKPNRRASRFIGIVLDITERKHAEEVIRDSEGRLKAMMDNTSAVIYLKDLQGRYLMINRRFEELCNVTQQQIAGKTGAGIFPSEVVARLQANDRQVRDTGQPLEFEEVVPHSDGPHTYVSVKFPIIDSAGQCIAVGGISTDISDRKRAADALKEEQELLHHTIKVQDQERQLVAYEIHDGLVQYATGALMQLESIQHQLTSEALAGQIENVVGILRKTVNEGRRIINGIHTTLLDDCGVVAAVQQLIEDEERAHVQIEFVKDEKVGRMAPNIELALYHITQEALTNAHKHSQSDKVRVELGRREDRVHLEVRDWGVGFTPPAASKGVHGLRGMTERARIAGGKCTVQNAHDKGTQVIVDLPYLSRN